MTSACCKRAAWRRKHSAWKDSLLLLFACMAFVLQTSCLSSAWAAPVEQEQEQEMSTLSNRYDSLNALESSQDTSDNVVVDTRVGVLTSVNRALDGATVSLSGEVVGDIINADEGHKWLNVQGSDGSSVGVYVTDEDAQRVLNVGGYKTTGTYLQIRGIYHIDCSDHQGELDVHALDIRVLDAGGAIDHAVNPNDIRFGLILCAVGVLLLAVFFGVRRWQDVQDDRERAKREVRWYSKRGRSNAGKSARSKRGPDLQDDSAGQADKGKSKDVSGGGQ